MGPCSAGDVCVSWDVQVASLSVSGRIFVDVGTGDVVMVVLGAV